MGKSTCMLCTCGSLFDACHQPDTAEQAEAGGSMIATPRWTSAVSRLRDAFQAPPQALKSELSCLNSFLIVRATIRLCFLPHPISVSLSFLSCLSLLGSSALQVGALGHKPQIFIESIWNQFSLFLNYCSLSDSVPPWNLERHTTATIRPPSRPLSSCTVDFHISLSSFSGTSERPL